MRVQAVRPDRPPPVPDYAGRATAGRLPRGAGPDGLARRADRTAQAWGLRRGQGRGAAADHRKRTVEIPAALCRTLPQRAGETDRALGMDQVPLIERGEVDVGIRHDQGANAWFASLAMPPDDVLAACSPSLPLGRSGMVDIVALAAHPLLLPDG